MIRTITTLCLALIAIPAMAQAPTTLTVGNLAPRLADAKAKACPGAPAIAARRVTDIYAEIAAIATCSRSPAPTTDLAPVPSAINALPERIAQRIGQPTPPAGPKAIIDLDFAKVRIAPGGAPDALAPPLLEGGRFQGNALSLYTDTFAHPGGPASYVQSSNGIAIKAVKASVTGTQHDGTKQTLPWRSAWLSTYGMPAIRKGDTISFRLRVPHMPGNVPAVWLLPKTGAWPPETDILEFFEKTDGSTSINTTQITAAAQPWTIRDNFWRVLSLPAGYDQADWHDYSFTWGDRMRLTIDGKQVYDEASIMPDEPMYLVYSNAVGLAGMGEPATKDAVVAEMAWLKVTR